MIVPSVPPRREGHPVAGAPEDQWRGSKDPAAPLVVLLHGRGVDETEIVTMADDLPVGFAYAAPRGGVALADGGFAWFERSGVGRPTTASLDEQVPRFASWLDRVAPPGRPVILIGFSGGAAFAGVLALMNPTRYAGVALLYGTLLFDSPVAVAPGRLAGLHVFHAQALGDAVIPRELSERTYEYLDRDAGSVNELHRRPGGHDVDPEVLVRLRAWVAGLAGVAP